MQVGHRAHWPPREQQIDADQRHAEVDITAALELARDGRAQPIDEIDRLAPIPQQAEHAQYAQRRRHARTDHAAGDDAVELAAPDALEHLGLATGGGAEVHLDAHGAVRVLLDVASEGVDLARPGGPLGRDRRHADDARGSSRGVEGAKEREEAGTENPRHGVDDTPIARG
jgi:hypothetical protein